MSVKDPTIWELLEDYGMIREELEDALCMYQELHSDLGLAMEDLQCELDEIQRHLEECSKHLMLYHGPSRRRSSIDTDPCELPFAD